MIVDTNNDTASIIMSTYRIQSSQEEAEALAHELGHYHTGTYYNSSYCAQNIGKMEYKANVWMVKRLLPPVAIRAAVAAGCCEIWEIAEHCNCTENLVKKAIEVYTQKGLL